MKDVAEVNNHISKLYPKNLNYSFSEFEDIWSPRIAGQINDMQIKLVKVKGNIHWVSTKYSLDAEAFLYDRLFISEQPGVESENYLDDINPNSVKTIKIKVEKNLADIKPGDQYQFERHGYFICDQNSTSAQLKINRTVTLRDAWK